MISFTGNGLNVLITSNCNFHDEWQSYASWYSIHKMLPDADVHLSVTKPSHPSQSLFRWATRAGVKRHRFANLAEDMGCVQATRLFAAYVALANNLPQPLAVIDCDTVAVREIALDCDSKFVVSEDKSVWVFNGMSADGFAPAVNQFFKLYDANEPSVDLALDAVEHKEAAGLCCPCVEGRATTFVKVDSCGHYDKKTWLKQAKSSPFAHTRKLRKVDLSVNEAAVLGLWGQLQKPHALMA